MHHSSTEASEEARKPGILPSWFPGFLRGIRIGRTLAIALLLVAPNALAAGWMESPPLASVVQQAKRLLLLVRIGTKW